MIWKIWTLKRDEKPSCACEADLSFMSHPLRLCTFSFLKMRPITFVAGHLDDFKDLIIAKI